jgi:hypothetical protein
MAKGALKHGGFAAGGLEETSVMWKYASKLLLDIFLSVVATVTAAYVTHHYFPASAPAKAPLSAAVAADPPSGGGAAASEPEHLAALEAPSNVVNAVAPAIAVAVRALDANHDETAGPSLAKPARPASMPSRKRPAPREKSILKPEMVAAPKAVQAGVVLAIVPAEPSRAPPERAGPPLEAPGVGEIRSERDVAGIPETRKPNLAGWVLKPIVRTVAVVAGVFSHERGPRGE